MDGLSQYRCNRFINLTGRTVVLHGPNGKPVYTLQGDPEKRARVAVEYYVVGVVNNRVPAVRLSYTVRGLPPKLGVDECLIVTMRVAAAICNNPAYKGYWDRVYVPNMLKGGLGKVEGYDSRGWFAAKSLIKPCVEVNDSG